MGVDSIVLFDGLRQLEQRYQVRLSLKSLSQKKATVGALARLLIEEAWPEGPPHPHPSLSERFVAVSSIDDEFVQLLRSHLAPDVSFSMPQLHLSDGTDLRMLMAGTGQPVVLLPPMDSIASAWKYQIEALVQRYQVIVPHLPGYAGSRFLQGATDLATQAQRLLDGLAHLGVKEPLHLVGWSFGGMLAQLVALKAPHRIASLSLVNTSGGFGLPSSVTAAAQIMKGLRDDFQRSASTLPEPHARLLQGLLFEGTRSVAPEVKLSYVDQALSFDGWRQTGSLGIPAFIVGGGADSITPPEQSLRLHRNIPASLYVLFEGAGHFIPMLEPERFNRELLSFLATHS
jgi:pimeloyl-ACP methyl ester carboxylesterase